SLSLLADHFELLLHGLHNSRRVRQYLQFTYVEPSKTKPLTNHCLGMTGPQPRGTTTVPSGRSRSRPLAAARIIRGVRVASKHPLKDSRVDMMGDSGKEPR